MIILRKLFSSRENKKKKERSSNDVNVLKSAGTTGMVIGGALGTGAAIEGGKSIKGLLDIKDDITGIRNLRKNKAIREVVKDQINKHVPKPYSDQVIEKTRFIEKHFPKVNKIDKYSKLYGLWDSASKNVSRTMLDNADRYAEMATDALIEKVGPEKLNETELKYVKRIPYVVRKGAKSITHWKNARALRKGAVIIGGLGATSYINGRMIEGDK